MTFCEWVIDDKGTSDASKWKECSREAGFTISLIGSYSAANCMFFCWQHKKKYENQAFLDETWGKGSKVEILRIGKSKEDKLCALRKLSISV